jgi:hypothetical protein
MAKHGTFIGVPKTEWLVNATAEDRYMCLIDDFAFTDPNGRIWPAAASSTIDGASIPRELWAVVGSPYTGDYRRASIVHDAACNTPGVNRKEADVMFFHACRAGGCNPMHAFVLYAGVRIGSLWSANLPARVLTREHTLFRTRLDVPLPQETFLQGKLADIAHSMRDLPDEPTIEQLDAAIEGHIKMR